MAKVAGQTDDQIPNEINGDRQSQLKLIQICNLIFGVIRRMAPPYATQPRNWWRYLVRFRCSFFSPNVSCIQVVVVVVFLYMNNDHQCLIKSINASFKDIYWHQLKYILRNS